MRPYGNLCPYKALVLSQARGLGPVQGSREPTRVQGQLTSVLDKLSPQEYNPPGGIFPQVSSPCQQRDQIPSMGSGFLQGLLHSPSSPSLQNL